VTTDVRLWLRDELWQLRGHLRRLLRVASDRAAAEVHLLMPGYTHLQPAQPVRWSHWLLSHAWAWQRDADRLADVQVRGGRGQARWGRSLCATRARLCRVRYASDVRA